MANNGYNHIIMVNNGYCNINGDFINKSSNIMRVTIVWHDMAIWINRPRNTSFLGDAHSLTFHLIWVYKTMPFLHIFTTHDWEWFIYTTSMVMTGGW